MSLIQVIKKENYEILKLNRGKANPMNNELITAIREEIERVATDDAVRGIILTGNTDGYFSGGLDVKELFHIDEEQLQHFLKNWKSMLSTLLGFPKPMIAAINGFSPAGGCILALLCDYRMMAQSDRFLIGLNELQVGIAVPEYIYTLYSFWIGERQANHNLLRGKLLTVKEALEQKLVDEVHPIEELLSKAEKELQVILQTPDNILQDAKLNIRAELIKKFEIDLVKDNESFTKNWFHPESRAVLEKVVASMSK